MQAVKGIQLFGSVFDPLLTDTVNFGSYSTIHCWIFFKIWWVCIEDGLREDGTEFEREGCRWTVWRQGMHAQGPKLMCRLQALGQEQRVCMSKDEGNIMRVKTSKALKDLSVQVSRFDSGAGHTEGKGGWMYGWETAQRDSSGESPPAHGVHEKIVHLKKILDHFRGKERVMQQRNWVRFPGSRRDRASSESDDNILADGVADRQMGF
ncbi:hypothetical protein C8R43DRAFT_958465 [Mycena crocata]|nr:hypothetical protein C8R43DRAFT_958465 [Mycena crocata]